MTRARPVQAKARDRLRHRPRWPRDGTTSPAGHPSRRDHRGSW